MKNILIKDENYESNTFFLADCISCSKGLLCKETKAYSSNYQIVSTLTD